MRFSNRKAVIWLLENQYDEVWLKAHTKRTDLTYTLGNWYRAMDLWNLFDGICFDKYGNIILIQVKTNAWAKGQDFVDFLSDKKHLKVLSINVKGKDRKWEVLTREYETL
jgi:hypothetical protein